MRQLENIDAQTAKAKPLSCHPASSRDDKECLTLSKHPAIQGPFNGQRRHFKGRLAHYFFAPFFLIIPLMASSVIAADSFAGEKERKTIEALLATPISDSELFLGKTIVSFIPSMAVTIISFVIYSIVFDLLAFSIFNGALLLPTLDWILLIFALAPTVALASIGLTVMVSAKVKGFKEAQQISAVLLIPVFALVFGQVTGALVFGPIVIAALIALFAVIDFAIFRIGVKLFKREEILSKIA
ncbi:ABC transporter permease [Candidatus Bathyarchaeota archaeon]|nr:ABC transporter permease [Candidatus Bathyarchaeota archaeon]